MDTISLTLSFDGYPFAMGEVDSSSLSLLRPFRNIAQGKPIGKINYVFFQGGTAAYVLGSLCYSPGARLLFFPGLTARSARWFSWGYKTLYNENALGIIDHLTLEKDLRRNEFTKGHITLTDARGRKRRVRPTFRSKLIDDSALFCFAMSVRSTSVLERMPLKIRFSFSSPPDDANRRIRDVEEARKDARFHIVSLPKNRKLKADEFLHFQFFLAAGNKFPVKDCFVLPYPPAVHQHKYESRYPCRIHPVALQGLDRKVWITVSKHLGELANDAIITMA